MVNFNVGHLNILWGEGWAGSDITAFTEAYTANQCISYATTVP